MKKFFALLLTASIFFTGCNDQGNDRNRDDRNTEDDRGNRNNRNDDDDTRNTRNNDDDDYRDDDRRNTKKDWTNADRSQWRKTCNQAIGQAQPNARELCDCVLQKMEAEYTSLNDADTRGGEAAGKRLMQECLGMSNDGGGGYENDDY
jgi:hypothetical protein